MVKGYGHADAPQAQINNSTVSAAKPGRWEEPTAGSRACYRSSFFFLKGTEIVRFT